MGRPVVLSNGQLFVGIDESGLVHDFYYPYVGLDNLTNARNSKHKVGVWIDGTFSWTDDGSWNTKVDFEPKALVSNISLESEKLQIRLQLIDFVDQQYNAFIRRIKIINLAETEQEVRLFMHQVFQISRAGRADTAFYVPDEDYIFDYKGRCCLLASGKHVSGGIFDQFAVGSYGIEGKDGTFRDAEDGELSGNAIEHGGVDSVLRFSMKIKGGQNTSLDYWVVAATSQNDAEAVHRRFKRQSMEERLLAVREYYDIWLNKSLSGLSGLDEREIVAAQKSLLIIKAHCDKRGSVLASGDSSIFNYGRDYYCYCWPRDAAYALWPFIRLGYYQEAKAFFKFARDTMHPDGYLMHKYQPDRAIGSTWHPLLHGNRKELAIQEDETASVIFMLGEYFASSKDTEFIKELYHDFIAPCARFMAQYVDSETGLPHASYDLWEQKFLTSTYSVSVVIAGLESSAMMAEALGYQESVEHWRNSAARMKESMDALYNPDGFFRKGFLLMEDGNLKFDNTLDISSLYGPYMFAGMSLRDERLVKTAEKIQTLLLNQSPIGGVIRYEHDGYFLAKKHYKGNPWIVCTLWLAQYYIGTNRREEAGVLMDWVLERMPLSGSLSEQYDPETGESLSVTPLVWSQAELVNTLLDKRTSNKNKEQKN